MLKNIKLIGALLVAVCAGTSMNAACVDGSCSRSATQSRQVSSRTVRKQPVRKQAAGKTAKKAGKRNVQVTQVVARQTGPRNAPNQSGKRGGCANGQCSR